MTPDQNLSVVGETTAWNLIGFEGSEWDIEQALGIEHSMGGRTLALVRIKGGRALYEQVHYGDSSTGDKVRLGRLDTANGRLHPIYRYVDGDTDMEVLAP